MITRKQDTTKEDLNIEQLLIAKQCIGVENSIDATSLMQLLGLPSVSSLSYHIRVCREHGQVILSTLNPYASGYFYPSNKEELEKYLDIFKSKADCMLSTIDRMRCQYADNS